MNSRPFLKGMEIGGWQAPSRFKVHIPRVDYSVPDVSQWQTWLNPPPADDSVAHEDH